MSGSAPGAAGCRRCGLSAQSAYVHRRRDPLFARGWDAALELAVPFCEQVLADRAIDGVEEEVWYRGELVGTRRRYDTRLLLAHLARLDGRPDSDQVRYDADRFDEIVALVAGAKAPEAMAGAGDLPLTREAHLVRAAADARDDAWDAVWPETGGDECDAAMSAAADAAEVQADAEAADWLERVRAVVDGLGDSVNPSTSQDPLPPRREADPQAARARIVRALAARQDSVNPSTSDDAGAPAQAEGAASGQYQPVNFGSGLTSSQKDLA